MPDATAATDPERLNKLHTLGNYIASQLKAGKTVRLNYICTHNSRRSVLGQMTAIAIAHHLGIGPVETYSGGTEVTACHPNTIAALQELGFQTASNNAETNPRYSISIGEGLAAVEVWSKVFDDKANPQDDFAAVLVCGSAAEECPFVPGASLRLPLSYEDPKRGDGQPNQMEIYMDAARTIGSEMLIAFNAAKAAFQN